MSRPPTHSDDPFRALPVTREEFITHVAESNAEFRIIQGKLGNGAETFNNQRVHIRTLEESIGRLQPDNRWLLGVIFAFVVPILGIAFAAGQYPDRGETTNIVIDKTSDVEESTEREIKRVESTVRADIARLEKRIEQLDAKITQGNKTIRRKR